MSEFAKAAGQAAAYLPQAFCLGELTEKHGNEMVPATETLGITFGLMTIDQFTEFCPIEDGDELTEQACMPYHWASSLALGILLVVVDQHFAPQGGFFSTSL